MLMRVYVCLWPRMVAYGSVRLGLVWELMGACRSLQRHDIAVIMFKCVLSVAVCHRGYLGNFILGATPITRQLVPAWIERHPKHAPTIRVFTASWMCLVLSGLFPGCRYTFSSVATCYITPALSPSHTLSCLLLS